ncbi:MAG: leucine-rich repeat protein [Clostridia bacterium]|nr:leucine-rich repeat protein [Clostridia bacterium]
MKMKLKNKVLCKISVIFTLLIFNMFISSYAVDPNVTQLDISVETNNHETIWVNQYSNLPNLQVVNIKSGITMIHDDAFASCPNLTDVTIPETVGYISEGAFWNSPKDIIIHGKPGTKAEQFARDYGYKFDSSGANTATLQDEALPTYVKNEIINTQNRIQQLKDKNMLSFSFITDIHGDQEGTSNLMNIQAFNKITDNNLVKLGVSAGDMTTGKYEDFLSGKALYNLDYYTKSLRKSNAPVLFARGNHDCNTRQSADVAISGNQYYETVLKGLRNEVVFNEDDLGGDYYYKDLEDKKIRICVLNAFNGANYEFIFGDKQLQFIANEALDLSKKDKPEEWQVLFISHTVDKAAHDEVPSDQQKLYDIINAFQQGEKRTIDNIQVDYTKQGKGTFIAFITGHHHNDTTTIKNDILIITVRSSSITFDRENKNTETYDENDLCFDVFSIDTENKELYSTRVGRGKDRKWNYDINNLKEEQPETRTKKDNIANSNNFIEAKTILNNNNNLVAVVTSNIPFNEKSNKTWKLSKDRKTYIKVLDDVTNPYTTTFTTTNGYWESYTFNIEKYIDKKGPKIQLKYNENDDGTITAIVTSDEILKTKTNKRWKLSEDRQTYKYTFTQTTSGYTTIFSDVFGNQQPLTLNAKIDKVIFKPEIEYIENVDGTITAKVTSNIEFAKTKPTWQLSDDMFTYTKTFIINQDYETNFIDIYGNEVIKNIKIDGLNRDLKLEIQYKKNADGSVTAMAISNNKFVETKPTWKLSNNGYTYTKTFTSNQDYKTDFTDIYGNRVEESIKIDEFNKTKIEYEINANGTVTAIATSGVKFANTKPTWKLSNNGYTYTKTFTSNQDYKTDFIDVYGNKDVMDIKISNFNKVEIKYETNADGTITAIATSNIKFANTKPTWKLSNDGYTYTKTFTDSQNYKTNFIDIYGNETIKEINI